MCSLIRYMFGHLVMLHHLLNVSVQFANKRGFKKQKRRTGLYVVEPDRPRVFFESREGGGGAALAPLFKDTGVRQNSVVCLISR
jgi:hypothetical protein